VTKIHKSNCILNKKQTVSSRFIFSRKNNKYQEEQGAGPTCKRALCEWNKRTLQQFWL